REAELLWIRKPSRRPADIASRTARRRSRAAVVSASKSASASGSESRSGAESDSLEALVSSPCSPADSGAGSGLGAATPTPGRASIAKVIASVRRPERRSIMRAPYLNRVHRPQHRARRAHFVGETKRHGRKRSTIEGAAADHAEPSRSSITVHRVDEVFPNRWPLLAHTRSGSSF